ncbi:mucin-17 [Bactrocera neohumeralis]|uniref:mucin-17 n=1 Tax=Bactrocera tryoni TaxID=59916 RepID=UPI001A95D2A7|nr:mucin-17 [Bactrocera tryoni]XP_050321715.1 mucin-17 [Bactrocera neohumeralis]
MKVLPILQPNRLLYLYFAVIVVIVVGDYASALQQQQPEQQTRREQDRPTTTPSKQQQPAHAEVNHTANKPLKFGTKIVDYPVAELNANITTINATDRQQSADTRNNKQENEKLQTDIQLNNAADIAPSSRVARRFDASTAPVTQTIGENDVPPVKKTQRTGSTSANAPSAALPIATATSKPKRRDGNSSRSSSRDGKSAAVAASQRSNSFDSQAQSARQLATNRARNSNAANVASQQTNRGSGKKSKVASQPTLTPAVAANSRREANKSRKALSATTVSAPISSSTPAATTVRAPVVANNPLSNPFSFFSPSLWALSSPPKALSTKKPPKKYTPPPVTTTTAASVKDKKSSLQKEKSTTLTPLASNQITTTALPPKKSTTDGPFRIALPTFNFFGNQAQRSPEAVGEKDKRNTAQNLRNLFDCPRESEVRFQLFPKICKVDGDCAVWNRDELCCEIFGAKSCVSGIAKPLEETSHTPILGLIPRKCPTRPLAELWWQVQECETDTDCWPRVCCPDGNKRYCRTSQPELETVPVPVKRSFNYLSEYIECTPPPPPIFDLHPKTCASTLDCFPNVCCQEAGLRHCRPPKKSLLTWMANFLNVDFVKRLAQNIVIK